VFIAVKVELQQFFEEELHLIIEIYLNAFN